MGAGGTSIPALSDRQYQPVAIVSRLHTGSIALRRLPWRPRNPFRPRASAGSGIGGADDELRNDDIGYMVAQNARSVVTKMRLALTPIASAPALRAERPRRPASLLQLQAPQVEQLPQDAVYAPPSRIPHLSMTSQTQAQVTRLRLPIQRAPWIHVPRSQTSSFPIYNKEIQYNGHG